MSIIFYFPEENIIKANYYALLNITDGNLRHHFLIAWAVGNPDQSVPESVFSQGFPFWPVEDLLTMPSHDLHLSSHVSILISCYKDTALVDWALLV